MSTSAVTNQTLGQFLAQEIPGMRLSEFGDDETYPNFQLASTGSLDAKISNSMVKPLVESYFKIRRIRLKLDEHMIGSFLDKGSEKLLVMTVSPRAGMIHADFAKI
jgi:hypothetical protein